jgi:hypothetical protein
VTSSGQRRVYVTRTIEALPPVIPGAVYHAHGDPGLKKDAFSIAICHTTDDTKTIHGGEDKTPTESVRDSE